MVEKSLKCDLLYIYRSKALVSDGNCGCSKTLDYRYSAWINLAFCTASENSLCLDRKYALI